MAVVAGPEHAAWFAANLRDEAVASVRLDGETHVVEAAPHLHNAGPHPVVLSSRFHLATQFVVYACHICGMALPERRA